MFVILPSNFCHVFRFASVLFHVLDASCSEKLSGDGRCIQTNFFSQQSYMLVHWVYTIIIALRDSMRFDYIISSTINLEKKCYLPFLLVTPVSFFRIQQLKHSQLFHQQSIAWPEIILRIQL